MPIYEYVCTSCDHRADILHGINDPGPHYCLSCGREGTMRKLFAPPAIHYKGSGWAKKDRGASSIRSGAKAATTPAESGGGDTAGGGSSSGASGGTGGSSSGASGGTSTKAGDQSSGASGPSKTGD